VTFTIGWTAPANIGLLPQHPGDGEDALFTVAWGPKHQATYYPWDPKSLLIAPGGDDVAPPPPAPPASGGGTAPVGGAGDLAPSPQIRAHVASANVAKRKDPGLFRRKGLTFALSLEAPATVTAVLVTASGSKKLSYTQTRKVTAGTDHLTLRPSEYGKLQTRRHKRVAAKLRLAIKYTDKSSGTVTKDVILEAPPK
jgi:hypothetical protein